MRASGAWMLVITLFLIACISASDVVCVIGDQEIAAHNTATGYVPTVWTQTTHADFLRGTASGTEVITASDSVALKSRYFDPGVYVLVGGSTTGFYRYNLTSRAWSAMAPAPVALSADTSMVYDGLGSIYTLAGGSSSAVYRYGVLSNSWSLVVSAPGPVGAGGDMAWDGTFLYVIGGGSGTAVWRLDPASLIWTNLATTPRSVGAGASVLVKDGALYIDRGGSTTTFWRYSLAAGTWTTRDSTNSKVGPGSDLILGPGGTLYCTYSSNGRQLGSYNITRNVWTTVSTQPYTVGYGGDISYGGGAIIYSINGNGQRYFYSYNRTLNSWEQMPMLPVAVNTGGCLVYVPPVLIGYALSGTLTSETMDTGAAGTRFVQAFWDMTAPALTSVTIEVRSSDTLSGGASGGAWHLLGSGDMSGLTGRYVQWRVTLATADISITPQLQEVRIYYYHV